MQLQPGARPVPGYPDYKLIRKLGAGAFCEVWHAHGPGGIEVALKFIRLEAHLLALEMRSLELMKSIRHPNLVSLFGAWHKDTWLILAMELCDRSLQERLTEALKQNLPGIPLSELLNYMSDAANGLDALNAKQVQHRDVKPANLLLLNSGVKVADFGLAKALEKTIATNSGGGTYLAPECFKGSLTQQSDQYSLAVTYYHLRTGKMLFKGDQAQLMYAHLEVDPDLSQLPPAEAAVLARALSKDPRMRWPKCKEFASELIRAYEQAKDDERRCQEAEQKQREVGREKGKVEALKRILTSHQEWLRGEKTGERANLSDANLGGANLAGADLRGADLSRINLAEADLSGAQLGPARWDGLSDESDGISTDLPGAKLCRANLSDANLTHANLSGANLVEANLSDADLSCANLCQANLSGANLSRTQLNANLTRALLYGANLSGADLDSADLIEAKLRGATLSGVFFGEVDFSNADLCEVDLSGADLPTVVFHKAKLHRAKLSAANLEGADLSSADLSWADLSNAKLSGANLSEANLSGADLCNAKMFRVDLYGANLINDD